MEGHEEVGERILAAYWRTYSWHVSNINFHVTQKRTQINADFKAWRWHGKDFTTFQEDEATFKEMNWDDVSLTPPSRVVAVPVAYARSGCGPCLAKIYHSRSLEEGLLLGKKKVARGCDRNRHTMIYAMCNMIFRCTTCGFGFFFFFRTLCYPACAQLFAPSENSSPLTLQWKLLRCLRNYSHLVCALGFLWEQGGKHIMNAWTSAHRIPLEKIDI